jgi:hypothetical protein
MALTVSISQKELERIAALAYEGKTLKVALASIGATGYTAQSTVANWITVEKSGNGYARFSSSIATGSYDTVDALYKIPAIDASYTATGVGYSYDRIVYWVDGATYPIGVITEDPNIALASGQTQTYRINLATDD